MKLVFQRVSGASVTADGEDRGAIGAGAVLLVGVEEGDGEAEALFLAKKAAQLRVFSDADGKFRYSLLDIGGGALVVSNFTLCANCTHGRRPEFLSAARPEKANPLYERFVKALAEEGVGTIVTGVFGADMTISMQADGPVTIVLDTAQLMRRKEGAS